MPITRAGKTRLGIVALPRYLLQAGTHERCNQGRIAAVFAGGRDVLVWKLDGLSDYDQRRPLTPTGTNLLGLVKHLAGVEAEYFGAVFQRPFPEKLPWLSTDAELNADMWALPEESRDEIVSLYQRVWAHADATIALLCLDATGHVPWWQEASNPVSLARILVHGTAETHRHAGQADIVRELADGSVGTQTGSKYVPARHREGATSAAASGGGQ